MKTCKEGKHNKFQYSSLENKVAIVTGAASGIGKAIAKLFAVKGANVLLVDRDAEKGAKVASEIKTCSSKATFVKADVAIESEVKLLVDKCMKKYGTPNILINNVGSNANPGKITEINFRDFNETLNNNLGSYFLCSKYVIPVMSRNEGGVIVNIASICGFRPIRNNIAYCVSKAGVIILTKCLALDHAAENIRVNAVAPGLIKTPFTQAYRESHPDAIKEKRILLGRIGEPEEVAKGILYLVSDASSYITGTILTIDGGVTIW